MSFVRGQTALEYLLMIAGGVLVAAVLMVVVNNNLTMAANSFESGDYSTRLQNYLSSGTGTDDGDWVIVGNNQFSGVPGYVGIGTTNPQAKLEVNGKILMDDATAASDSANTVATKGYVDNNLANIAITAANSTWNASGNNQYSLVAGNVGIGTSNPSSKLTVNGSVDVSNHTITGLAAPVSDSDAANKGYVDAAGGSGGNTTVIFNSTLDMGMPLQGVIDYSPPTTSYVSTIPLSLPKANCGVKITACNSPPGSLVIGADPVPRIVVPNIHHATIHEVSPTTSVAGSSVTTSGSVGCGAWCWGAYSNVAEYCTAGYACAVTATATFGYDESGNACWSGGGICCPSGTTYDISNENHWCHSCPSGTTWDAISRVCYSGANTATNRCPAAGTGETFLRWTNTLASRTCTYYNATVYADTTKKFIMEESDKYVYCPIDHPTYDSTTKLCIKANTVQTTPIGTYCATLNTYLPTSFTDVTFRNAADTAYVTSTYIMVAYNCPSD